MPRDLLPLLPLLAHRVQQDRNSLQATPRPGPRKEAQFHSFSPRPGQAKSAESKPNYRAVGRAVPTSSEQKAVVSTRRKLLHWQPSLSPLSSTTREEALTPDAAEVTGVAQGKPGHCVLGQNPMLTSSDELKESVSSTAPRSAPLLHTPRKKSKHSRGCCSPEASSPPQISL